jgi:hypothetical protein
MQTKLSAITGVQASGVHMAIVPPENEAPYSSVHASLCGIGNNYLLDWYWEKTTDTPTCAECAGRADELYAEGATLFDPESYRPLSWYTGPPMPLYDLCPVDSLDGMIDLPTVSTPKSTIGEAPAGSIAEAVSEILKRLKKEDEDDEMR